MSIKYWCVLQPWWHNFTYISMQHKPTQWPEVGTFLPRSRLLLRPSTVTAQSGKPGRLNTGKQAKQTANAGPRDPRGCSARRTNSHAEAERLAAAAPARRPCRALLRGAGNTCTRQRINEQTPGAGCWWVFLDNKARMFFSLLTRVLC